MTSIRADGMTDQRTEVAPETGAWESFCAQHYTRLVGLAGLVCGDVVSAQDVVQTALERAWRSRRTLRDDDHLRPWLDRIVVREAARERRFQIRWLGRLHRGPTMTEIESAERNIVDPAATRLHDRAALRVAIGELSAVQRAVIVLHLHEGYSIDETAEALGVPRDTVRSRLRAARGHLRRALRDES